MISVQDSQTVLRRIEAMRAVSPAPVMNLFYNKDILENWIRKGLLFYEEIGRVAFFFKKDADFYHLYFVCPTAEELGGGLDALATRPEILTADVVTKIEDPAAVTKICLGHGFHHYRTLIRLFMTRSPDRAGEPGSPETRYAREDDVGKLHEILAGNFDRFAEQIPSLDEIALDIAKNRFIIKEEGERVAGLIHFEVAGLTSHLRRWFVDPAFRDRHIGSKLWLSYMSSSPRATRFILWVLQGNENAIKRYLHYGYREDNLIDTIFINKERVDRGK
jgi:ribosomal protein S18 acetylase RimI-like enzyme